MIQTKIEEFCGERNAELVDRLTGVWNSSVRTSHHFLSEQDITGLIPQVKAALQGIEHLIIAWEGAEPVGFMGIQEHKIEMLFLAPSSIGKGLGREMIKLAIDRYGAEYVDVNEQNEQAEGFYRHMGFRTFRRDETDEQGNPFPILHMRIAKKIVVLLASGKRKGNTAQLVDSFARGATEAGHEVEVISLVEHEVKGCLGCNACRYEKPCVQKDAFNGLVPKIKEADCLVFASPLYFWTVSARIKAFIERFYSIAIKDDNPPFGRYEKYPVKDCALLMTAADDNFWTFDKAADYYRYTFIHYIGFHDKGMLLAGGCGHTDGKPQIDKTNHLEEAYEFGKNIYGKD